MKLISFENIRAGNYLTIHEAKGTKIWHPKMSFLNTLEVEKNRGIGYQDMNEYYASFNNKIIMGETLKIKFSCNFAFRYFD